MPYSIGFEAGLSLGFSLDMGNRVHEPMGVRVTLYPEIPLYGCKPLYLPGTLYL
jgi:hypothetical protein